jgi:serine-type D-Ala-D-Ala carboxypeptidase/endopeptidase (penicillin-binding protein 4)
MKKQCLILLYIVAMGYACTPSKSLKKSLPNSLQVLLADSALLNAHTGVSVVNTSNQHILFSHQSNKYFVPASNTKLFTCYAALKYLDDSLIGLKYNMQPNGSLLLQPTGDPTLLHSNYANNNVLTFLQKQQKPMFITANNWQETALGNGWAWNDYDALYMTERSPMPIYENAATITVTETNNAATLVSTPPMPTNVIFQVNNTLKQVTFKRDFTANTYKVQGPNMGTTFTEKIPFATNGIATTLQILNAKLGSGNAIQALPDSTTVYNNVQWQTIQSQPTDSLLQPMMYDSDNFFAEQSLLMVSNQQLGTMSTRSIINHLLATDLKNLPQKPVWVDGSGLSRYNLFTPASIIALLQQMKNEFGMERIKKILPTGGKGTLSSLYKPIANQIFAKTGTLSGQVALSGFLYTKSNALLAFSILVNNHNSTASNVRKAVEKFILSLWQQH